MNRNQILMLCNPNLIKELASLILDYADFASRLKCNITTHKLPSTMITEDKLIYIGYVKGDIHVYNEFLSHKATLIHHQFKITCLLLIDKKLCSGDSDEKLLFGIIIIIVIDIIYIIEMNLYNLMDMKIRLKR